MQELKFHLSLATLIPEFIYQFLSTELVEQNTFTCLELEDVRNSIVKSQLVNLNNINKFLMINEEDFKLQNNKNTIENIDEELKEIDNEYYHKYSAGELKYIFDEIINNIDIIYNAFKKETGINLLLTIGFKFKDGPETNMVIEFLNIEEKNEYFEDMFFLPIDNCFVSDNIIARIYFYYDKNEIKKYEYFLNQIFDIINLKFNKNNSLN